MFSRKVVAFSHFLDHALLHQLSIFFYYSVALQKGLFVVFFLLRLSLYYDDDEKQKCNGVNENSK
jgi:hypothetical protein